MWFYRNSSRSAGCGSSPSGEPTWEPPVPRMAQSKSEERHWRASPCWQGGGTRADVRDPAGWHERRRRTEVTPDPLGRVTSRFFWTLSFLMVLDFHLRQFVTKKWCCLPRADVAGWEWAVTESQRGARRSHLESPRVPTQEGWLCENGLTVWEVENSSHRFSGVQCNTFIIWRAMTSLSYFTEYHSR